MSQEFNIVVYVAMAAFVYLMLWIVHVLSPDMGNDADDSKLVLRNPWGRLASAALWPILICYIGWQLYEERDGR